MRYTAEWKGISSKMQDQRSLLAQFLRFSSATVASLMVFSLYSIVDGLFVAKGVGDYAMAAVNLAVPFTNVMFSIAVTFAVGTSTILSIYLGQGNREHANRLFSQNLALLVVIGLTITALVLIFLKPFALLLGAEEETLGYTMSYLRGLAPFAICFIVSYNLEILVKTDGRPMLAVLTVCIGCLTNCVLDYVAIFVLNWGAWGAAFATGLSQLLTCVIYITHFLGKHTTFHLVRFRPEGSIYRRLIPIAKADAKLLRAERLDHAVAADRLAARCAGKTQREREQQRRDPFCMLQGKPSQMKNQKSAPDADALFIIPNLARPCKREKLNFLLHFCHGRSL